MSQSELRNFEKSMAYHLAPAMLGIKPACLMSMEKNKDGLEENVELFNSRAYTKGMKLTVLCECKSRKLLFLYNEKLLSDRLADIRVRKLLESFGYDSRMTLEQQLERLSGSSQNRTSACQNPGKIRLFHNPVVCIHKTFIAVFKSNYLYVIEHLVQRFCHASHRRI